MDALEMSTPIPARTAIRSRIARLTQDTKITQHQEGHVHYGSRAPAVTAQLTTYFLALPTLVLPLNLDPSRLTRISRIGQCQRFLRQEQTKVRTVPDSFYQDTKLLRYDKHQHQPRESDLWVQFLLR